MRSVISKEDDESALDREEDQHSSVRNGLYFKEIDEEDKEKTFRHVGHELREESLEKNCLMRMIEGNRARGKKKISAWDQDAGWREKRWRSRPPERR